MEICTCGLVNQVKAGIEVRDGADYCKKCGRLADTPKSRQPTPPPPDPALGSKPVSVAELATGMGHPKRVALGGPVESSYVGDAADAADAAADRLETTATVLLVLGVVGGAILFLVGATMQVCPGGGSGCSSYDRHSQADAGLMGSGLISILFWFFIWATAKALAMRIHLAAAVARERIK